MKKEMACCKANGGHYVTSSTTSLKAKTLTEAQMNAYELAMRLQHLERALDEFAEQLRQGVCTVSGHPK